jgi:hypothetical protein
MKNSEGDERERSKRKKEKRGKKQERWYFLDVKTRPGIFDLSRPGCSFWPLMRSM